MSTLRRERTDVAAHHDYWNAFYASRASAAVPAAPSAFAEWVVQRLEAGQLIAELGFGTARDALSFARRGHPVIGFDFAECAVQLAQGHADGQRLPATFSVLDLYDSNAIGVATNAIAARTSTPAIYGRFLLHALADDGRQNVLDLAAAVLPEGGELYLEFRTGRDRDEQHLFGDDHFRAYLDPDDMADEIEQHGGTVIHAEAGYGRALYKTEDPHVARLVARWSR